MSILDDYSIAFPARDAFYHGLSRDFYNEFSEFRDVFDKANDFMKEDIYEVAYKNPTGTVMDETGYDIPHVAYVGAFAAD